MAHYAYLCGSCGSQDDREFHIGTALRTTRCPECAGIMRLRIGVGVNVAASALENKGVTIRDADAREKRWDTDIPAYRRMRHKGMQPKGIDGSARLENEVGDQFDIHYQGVQQRTGASRERLMEGVEQAAEIMDTVKTA